MRDLLPPPHPGRRLMAAQWQRWLRYAKAKLDATVREGEAELDRREAELQARAEGRPWLSSTGDAPTLDEARARIEHEARRAEEERRRREAGGQGSSGPPDGGTPAAPAPPGAARPQEAPPGEPSPPLTTDPQLGSFDFAAQQRAAEERLAAIRAELGLAPDEAPAAGEEADADRGDTAGPPGDDADEDGPGDDGPGAPAAPT